MARVVSRKQPASGKKRVMATVFYLSKYPRPVPEVQVAPRVSPGNPPEPVVATPDFRQELSRGVKIVKSFRVYALLVFPCLAQSNAAAVVSLIR